MYTVGVGDMIKNIASRYLKAFLRNTTCIRIKLTVHFKITNCLQFFLLNSEMEGFSFTILKHETLASNQFLIVCDCYKNTDNICNISKLYIIISPSPNYSLLYTVHRLGCHCDTKM